MSALFLLSAGLLVPCLANADQRPLVVVPGIVGSVLSDGQGEVVWGDSGSLNKSSFKALDLLPQDGAPLPLEASDIIREVPLIFGLIGVGVYSDLIDFLTGKRGIVDRITGNEFFGQYEEGANLFVFPYDWRRSNFSSAKALNDFIIENIPEGDYDLVAHSMGGLITRIMLDGRPAGGVCWGEPNTGSDLPEPDSDTRAVLCDAIYGTPEGTTWPNDQFQGPYPAAERLHTFVELAVPHKGSTNVAASFLEGWGSLSRLFIGGRRAIQNTILSMAAPYELLPTYENCCAFGASGATGNQAVGDSLDYELWAEKVLGFGLQRCPYDRCDLKRHLLAAGLHNRRVIEAIVSDQVLNKVQAYYGVIGRDVEGTRETFYVSFSASGDGDGITYRTNSEGDGTVHRISAVPPEYGNVPTLTSYRTTHPFIFKNDAIKRQLYSFIIDPVNAPIRGVAGEILEVADVDIHAVGLEVAPRIALSGDALDLHLTLVSRETDAFSDQSFEEFRLPAEIQAYPSGAVAVSGAVLFDEDHSLLASGRLALSGQLIAPAAPGVYLIIVRDEDSEVVIVQDQLHVIGQEE